MDENFSSRGGEGGAEAGNIFEMEKGSFGDLSDVGFE